MAVTFPDAATTSGASVNTLNPSYSHTVSAGTSLLLVFVASQANETAESVTWNGNSLDPITRIDEGSTSSADVFIHVWGLLSPTADTGDVAITGGGAYNNWYLSVALNVAGTETSSLGAAISLLTVDENNTTTTNQSVHASGGGAGNKLLFAGAAIGDDMVPATNDDTFTDLIGSGGLNSGGGAGTAADGCCYIAEKDAASGITVNWGATDENVSGLFEIVAAGGVVNTSIIVPTGPWR